MKLIDLFIRYLPWLTVTVFKMAATQTYIRRQKLKGIVPSSRPNEIRT